MSTRTVRLYDGVKEATAALGDAVKTLQGELNKNGYLLEVDGRFGRRTEAAVRAFQRAHALHDDGVVGPSTWAALMRASTADEPNVFDTSYAGNDAALLAQLDAVAPYRAVIEEGARVSDVPLCVIVGLGSRESHWGLALKPKGPAGTGDFTKRRYPTRHRKGALPPDGGGFGRGLLQIDYDAHEFARVGGWHDARQNILYGCGVLRANVRFMRRKTELTDRALLRAAIAAYNCGPGNALKAYQGGRDIDFYTAGRDYSADVLDRAGFFQGKGWP